MRQRQREQSIGFWRVGFLDEDGYSAWPSRDCHSWAEEVPKVHCGLRIC